MPLWVKQDPKGPFAPKSRPIKGFSSAAGGKRHEFQRRWPAAEARRLSSPWDSHWPDGPQAGAGVQRLS